MEVCPRAAIGVRLAAPPAPEDAREAPKKCRLPVWHIWPSKVERRQTGSWSVYSHATLWQGIWACADWHFAITAAPYVEICGRRDGWPVHWLAEATAGGKMTAMVSIDRQRGTRQGLAVANALDAAVEFKMPSNF